MKKWIALFLVACLLCGVLSGCGKKIAQEEAYAIVLEDLEKNTSAAVDSVHVHEGTYGDTPCFNVYVTVSGVSLHYAVSMTGKILYKGTGEAHSH